MALTWESWVGAGGSAVQRAADTVREVQLPRVKWYVVLVPDDAEPELFECDTFEESRELLGGLSRLEQYAAFVFCGTRCPIFRKIEGVDRRLSYMIQHPDGSQYPLREREPEVEELHDGHFGPPTTTIDAPPTGLVPYDDNDDIIDAEWSPADSAK